MRRLSIDVAAGDLTCGNCHMRDRMLWKVFCLLFHVRLKTLIIDVRRKGLKGGKQVVYRCSGCLSSDITK